MATVSGARRLSCSARCTISLVLPAPGGEATTTAGSPDQAANNAAARIGSLGCSAVGTGGGGGVPECVGAEFSVGAAALSGFWIGVSVRRARPSAVGRRATRQQRQPRRAVRP